MQLHFHFISFVMVIESTFEVALMSWVELSPDICMRRRTRCSVTTALDDGSRDEMFVCGVWLLQGVESISDYAISFHYVTVEQLYNLDFYVYHLRPYGVVSGLQELNQPRETPTPVSSPMPSVADAVWWQLLILFHACSRGHGRPAGVFFKRWTVAQIRGGPPVRVWGKAPCRSWRHVLK